MLSALVILLPSALELVLELGDDAPVHDRVDGSRRTLDVVLGSLDQGDRFTIGLGEAHITETVGDVETNLRIIIVKVKALEVAHHWNVDQ